jgi:predicted RNA binding protein YcfA (HicA-like mRNA interferase family)
MPRKVRQIKAELKKAGFSWRPGKGSHTVWRHPLLPHIKVTVSGGDGDDAQDYQEKEAREALRALEEVLKQQKKGKP